MWKTKKKQIFIILMILSIPIAAYCNTAVVKKVLSGDIVQLGDTFVARLTGIVAPPRNEIIGYKIYDFTKRELEGKVVKIFTWSKDNTKAGIVYDEKGYPFVEIVYGKEGSLSFNEVLLKKGYARIDHKYLPGHLKHYVDLEKEAREKGLGIWKEKSQEESVCKVRVHNN